MQKVGLKLKALKCKLLKPETEYLRFIVSAKGIFPIPAKVDVVQKPTPSTRQIIFVVCCFRFVGEFAHVAQALVLFAH